MMIVSVELDGRELTKGIEFHGETYKDKETVKNISKLSCVLEDVMFDLERVYYTVLDRNEKSAIEIKERLELLEKDLGTKLFERYKEEE